MISGSYREIKGKNTQNNFTKTFRSVRVLTHLYCKYRVYVRKYITGVNENKSFLQ